MFYVLWDSPTGLHTWTGPFNDRQAADAVAASHHIPGCVVVDVDTAEAAGGRMSPDLRAIADDRALLEIGRKAVEDALIDFRDRRISLMNRGNGLVIREPDGTGSDVIRLGAEDALRIGLKAIAGHLDTATCEQR